MSLMLNRMLHDPFWTSECHNQNEYGMVLPQNLVFAPMRINTVCPTPVR